MLLLFFIVLIVWEWRASRKEMAAWRKEGK
jgi:cbb3-type cytochrome oxidase subunit 3